MGKRSQKHRSRGQIRRRRQLKSKEQRFKSREDGRYVYDAFALGPFLRSHVGEILFICILLLIATAVIMLRPDQEVLEAQKDSVSSLLLDQTFEWQNEYPQGYKIIALTDTGIMHTTYDTFPEDLGVDWKGLTVARIKANRITHTEEKIRIEMEEFNYPPSNIFGLSMKVTLQRKKGAKSVLTDLGDKIFEVRILEDQGGYVFCLFGLKGK